MNSKTILFLIVNLFIIIILSGCAFKPDNNNIIRIVGSDTMFELTKNLADEYMKENPGISIYVKGGGTGIGISALINDQADICTASRNLRPIESKQLAEYYGSVGMVFLIAKDALSVYVNKRNQVKDISITNLKKIFTGKINNWKYLGGKDTLITTVIRNPNSGTYLYFKEHILEDEEYSPNSIIEPTTKDITIFVSQNLNAIGYGGMGFKDDIDQININGIAPVESNVRNDTYPITRYLHFFTTKNPRGEIKNFIDWTLSPTGQNIIRKSGFISLWEH